jgi:hypothetical protein
MNTLNQELKSQAERIASLLQKAPVTAKAAKEPKNPFKVVLGNVYMQPISTVKVDAVDERTKKKVKKSVYTENASDYKWHMVYIGFNDANGKHSTGFTMQTKDLLNNISVGNFGKAVSDCFESFCKACSDGTQTLVQIKD